MFKPDAEGSGEAFLFGITALVRAHVKTVTTVRNGLIGRGPVNVSQITAISFAVLTPAVNLGRLAPKYVRSRGDG